MEKVVILLAAYNGGPYIRQTIQSVLEQDYRELHLVLSDDGSSDGTAEILEEYRARYPRKITHYRSCVRFGNAQDHFMHLLARFGDADYLMFCDQDDIWHPDKVTRTLQKMKETEIPGLPALVHTDLRVVDGDLKEIDPSFIHYSNLDGRRMELRQLLVQNVVTGCTVMINRPLAWLATAHVPKKGILMHDWWLALIAASMGTVDYLEEATIDYRQHGGNAVGAKNSRSAAYILEKLRENRSGEGMAQTFRQAAAFLENFGSRLYPEQARLVAEYAALERRGWLARRWAYIRWGFWKAGWTRKIGQLFLG